MDKGYYQEYYVHERAHWWFLARLKILEAQVQLLAKDGPLRILNIGIATGATSEMLQKYGELTSIEYDQDCCDFVREVVKIPVIHGSILELPFEEGNFDLVCALDVIEHVEDDQLAVNEMIRVCKTEGNILVTVPAFMSLWSDHDVINHHFRRYKANQLKNLFVHKGEIEYTGYFNTFFFLPIFFLRQISNLLKSKGAEPKSDLKKFKAGFLNTLLYKIFLLEKGVLKRGWHFPFGVSIMLKWRK